MLTKTSVFTNVPPISREKLTYDYLKNRKSEFMEAKLFKVGQELEKDKTQAISAEQYAKKQMDTKEIREQLEPMSVPTSLDDPLLKAKNNEVFTGTLQKWVSGFCGGALQKKKVTASVRDGRMTLFEIDKDGKEVPITDQFAKLSVAVQLKTVKEHQGQPSLQLGPKKQKIEEHKKLVPSSVSGEYMLELDQTAPTDKKGSKAPTATVFLFFKNEDEATLFKNVMLCHTNEGKEVSNSRELGGGGAIKDIIQVRKFVISQMLFGNIDQYLTLKYNELQDKREREKRFLQNMQPKLPQKPTRVQLRATIRRICLRKNLEDLLGQTKKRTDALKVFLNKLIQDFSSRSNQQAGGADMGQGIAPLQFMAWKAKVDELKQRALGLRNIGYRMQVLKFYDFQTFRRPRDSKDPETFLLKVHFTREPIEQRRVQQNPARKEPFSLTVVVVPETKNPIQSFSYRALTQGQSLDLHALVQSFPSQGGQDQDFYLTVEKTQRGGPSIYYSSQRINLDRIDTHLPLKMNVEGVDVAGQIDVMQGILLFLREGVTYTDIKDPVFDELMQPRSFGMMRSRAVYHEGALALNSLNLALGVGKQFEAQKLEFKEAYNRAHEVLRIEQSLQSEGQTEWSVFLTYYSQSIGRSLRPAQSPPIISEPNAFRQQFAERFWRQPNGPSGPEDYDPLAATADPSYYTFYGRSDWAPSGTASVTEIDNRDLIYRKALSVGAAEFEYLYIWKSLGKTPLIRALVFSILSKGSPIGRTDKFIAGLKPQDNLLDKITDRFKDHLNKNPSIQKDFIELQTRYNLDTEKAQLIEKLLIGYLSFSDLLDFVSNNAEVRDPCILKGFTLRIVGGIVNIAHRLVDLYYITSKSGNKNAQSKKVTEEDLFLIFLAIAMVFLPDQFIVPVSMEQLDQAAIKTREDYCALGLDLRAFISNNQNDSATFTASYKLALVFGKMIRKSSPEAYLKMNRMGFPFISFCIDTIDSLYAEFFNTHMLAKYWNTVFFEGSHRVKRRSQQMLLLTILSLIQSCKTRILHSHSPQEVIWHLRSQGLLNFQSTEFIHDIFYLRDKFLVLPESAGTTEEIASELMGIVSGEEQRIEHIFKAIKAKLQKKLETVSLANKAFLRLMRNHYIVFLNKNDELHQHRQETAVAHFKQFFNCWVVEPIDANPQLPTQQPAQQPTQSKDTVRQSQVLNLHNEVELPTAFGGATQQTRTRTDIKRLAGVPAIKSVTFGIVHCELGGFLPRETCVQLVSSFSVEEYLLKPGDQSWHRNYEFDAKLVRVPQEAWIELQFESRDRAKKTVRFSKRVYVDSVRLNREQYFSIKLASVWLVYSFKVSTEKPEAFFREKIESTVSFENDEIYQMSEEAEELANELKIESELPYREELLNSIFSDSDSKLLQEIFRHALKLPELHLGSSWEDFRTRCLSTGLLGKEKPTLFELMVRFVLFAPADNRSVFRLLFGLLTKLDLNRNNYRVKRSHVEFLVWFVLHSAQVFVPLSEVVSLVAHGLHGSDAYFASVSLVQQEETEFVTHDLTGRFNDWLAASRRRTGVAQVQLGSKGSLDKLQTAVELWGVPKQRLANPTRQATRLPLPKRNRLKACMNCHGKLRTVELVFDDRYRLVHDPPLADGQSQGSHVLVLGDSEESLCFEQFVELLSKIQVLDAAFSKLTCLGGDRSALSIWKNLDLYAADDYFKKLRVTVKHQAIFEGPDGSSRAIDLGTAVLSSSQGQPPRVPLDSGKLAQLVRLRQQLTYSEAGLYIGGSAATRLLDPDVSVRSLLSLSRAALVRALLDRFDERKALLDCHQESLQLLAAEAEPASVQLQGRELQLAYLDANLGDLALALKANSVDLNLTCTHRPTADFQVFSCFAKDAHRLGGVLAFDNPLVPCHLVQKLARQAKVVFEGESGKIRSRRSENRADR